MLKELVACLFLAGIASASSSGHGLPLDVASPPFYNIPLETKILQSQHAGIPSNVYLYVVSSDPEYSFNPAIVKTVAAPIAEKKVTIESHHQVTAHPLKAAYIVTPSEIPQPVPNLVQTVDNRPPVQVPVAHSDYDSVQIASNTVQSQEIVTANPLPAYVVSSTAAPPHQVPAVNSPTVQYVAASAAPIKSDLVKPLSPKTVTIESHQSVTAHPPTPTLKYVQPVANSPSVQYVSTPIKVPVIYDAATVPYQGPSRAYYAQSPAVNRPIPVPVIYTAEESSAAQYIGETKQIFPAPEIISLPTPVPTAQPVALQVAYPSSADFIRRNHKVSTPVVYTKSIVEKDRVPADLVTTHVRPRYRGYARAVTYSPASAVSRVSFNGNGVSYDW